MRTASRGAFMAALISGLAAIGTRYHAPVIRPDNRPKQPRQPKQYRFYTSAVYAAEMEAANNG